MTDSPLPILGASELRALAPSAGCPQCAALVCPSWESLPGTFPRERLARIGSLRQPGDHDPSLQEWHPRGTRAWSADAPIAPAWHPYNRCELWACTQCARPFLRYTEYGGYYEDERIRALDPSLVDGTPLPSG